MKVQHLQRQKRYDEKLAAFVKDQLLLKAEGNRTTAADKIGSPEITVRSYAAL
jgi:hypothetical protein